MGIVPLGLLTGVKDRLQTVDLRWNIFHARLELQREVARIVA